MKRSDIKRRPLSGITLGNLAPATGAYRELDGSGLYYRVKSLTGKNRGSYVIRSQTENGRGSGLGVTQKSAAPLPGKRQPN